MFDCELVSTKGCILELFLELNDAELDAVERWISSQCYKKDLQKKKDLKNTEKKLIQIGNCIKKIVPFCAELSSEKIVPPSVGDQADCNSINTCHVDEFLYDQDEVDTLVKEGKLRRHYCLDCNSRNIKDLTYISHSMSQHVLQYIFKVLLPEDLEGKQLLDVGSRLGSVLYGAYYFTNVSKIIGVEMNKECCEVQEQIIKKYSMDCSRVKVVHSDVTLRSDLVESSNIIIINVLDFFVDVEKCKEMWLFFKKHMQKGSYVILNRNMADTFEALNISEEFLDWLNICKPNQLENEVYFDLEDCSEIFLYTVN